MPPRYTYWTIILDGQPTAFRAADREALLPTLRQLQSKNPDAVLKWFAHGKVWDSPEAARAAQGQRGGGRDRRQAGGERREAGSGPPSALRPPRPSEHGHRGKNWRPGGEHRDPREKFKKETFQARKRREKKAAALQRQGGAAGAPTRDWNRRPDKPAAPKREWNRGAKAGPPSPKRPWENRRPKQQERRPWDKRRSGLQTRGSAGSPRPKHVEGRREGGPSSPPGEDFRNRAERPPAAPPEMPRPVVPEPSRPPEPARPAPPYTEERRPSRPGPPAESIRIPPAPPEQGGPPEDSGTPAPPHKTKMPRLRKG